MLKQVSTKTWPPRISFAAALEKVNIPPRKLQECWDRKVASLNSDKSLDDLLGLIETACFHKPCPEEQTSEVLDLKIWFLRQIVEPETTESAMEPGGSDKNVCNDYLCVSVYACA